MITVGTAGWALREISGGCSVRASIANCHSLARHAAAVVARFSHSPRDE